MKLFRRLSGKATRPEGFLSYARYAIGEIVLVVAGILIAVSLNNWNERRKDAATLDQVFAVIRADLKHDLSETAQALEFYERRQDVFDRVVEGKLSRGDYLENKPYAFLLIGYPEVTFHERGFNLLKEFDGAISLDRQELLGELIAFYTERGVEVTADDKIRADDFMSNFWHFKNEMSWWADLIHHKEIGGFLDYALEDPDYRNRVATTRFIAYDVFVPELTEFKEKATDLLALIDAVLVED